MKMLWSMRPREVIVEIGRKGGDSSVSVIAV